MPLSNGQQFAGYTVQRLIGAGGMGEVYLVHHPRLPRQDALKILPAHLAYHLFKGAPPFIDSNPAVVIGQHLNTAPPSLGMTRPDLAPLDLVFTRALAKAPDQRFGNCLDFATALRAAAADVRSGNAAVTGSPFKPPAAEARLADSEATVASPGGPAVIPRAAIDDPFEQQPTQLRPLLPPDPQPPNRLAAKRSRTTALIVPIVLVILVIAAGTFAAMTSARADRHADAPPRWAIFVQAGRQTAIYLTSINVATVDADVQRILDNSTGTFHAQFVQRAQPFTQTVRDAKSVAVGTVTEAGIEDLDGDRAHVLVAVTVNTTLPDQPPQVPRAWRMRISVVRDGDAYKADNLEFVA